MASQVTMRAPCATVVGNVARSSQLRPLAATSISGATSYRPALLMSQRSGASSSLIVTRADGPRVTREFREAEDGTLVEASTQASAPQERQPGQPLYADEAAPQVRKKTSNMSKEMKAKLREEYLGFGGSENKVLPHPRRPVVVAIATVEPREQQQQSSSPAAAVQPQQAPDQPQQPQGPVRSSKWKIDEKENLKSTFEHRLWTFGSMGLMGATLVQGLAQAHTAPDWAAVAAALAASYVLSDLGTGIYHWGVDNWGGAETPFFGRQIAAFQGHHQRPWTITEREFCNNVHQVFQPAAYPAAFFLLLSPWASSSFNVFISTFIFLVCMSQQFHAWSHMKKSELPGFVVALQDANVLISRKMHGAHHKAPFNDNYCIVSGLWNPVLDQTGFFKNLERACHGLTGIEPRSWHDPEHDWAELQRPEKQ